MAKVEYRRWQTIRAAARKNEELERGSDLSASRPPIQVSISDQIVRDLIDRVEQLEAAGKPAPQSYDATHFKQ